ncbi:MAG: hypothetical protein UZ21_OP11001000356 [Microgenomates bacterium OLB22]|nr:MAG: hypothetical protein UZ21_OP11001000356 [Microgenomates bacterium OLB22]
MIQSLITTLLQNGLSEHTIVTLLYLPIAAAMVAVARYIIGWKSFSMYATLLVTFVFYELSYNPITDSINLVSGLQMGGILLMLSILSAFLSHTLLNEIRMHYLSKLGVAFTTASIFIGLVMYLLVLIFPIASGTLNTIPVIMIIFMVDIIIRNYVRKGFRKTMILTAYSLVLALGMYFVFAQEAVRGFVLAHPESVFYALIITILTGKWLGLRLIEYLRFGDLLVGKNENAKLVEEEG